MVHKMGRKYYDEFSKLPVDKMAQSISDMTYGFENTVVPKEHYKKTLNKELIELMSNEPSIEINLLKPYYDMLNEMQKENPKFFFKALLLIDTKTTYTSISSPMIDALEYCWQEFSKIKKNTVIKEEITEDFKRVSSQGMDSLLEDIDGTDKSNLN